MLLTMQVSPDYPSQLGDQLCKAFKDAGVTVTAEPSEEACHVVCLCENFETNIHLTKTVFRQPRNVGDRQTNTQKNMQGSIQLPSQRVARAGGSGWLAARRVAAREAYQARERSQQMRPFMKVWVEVISLAPRLLQLVSDAQSAQSGNEETDAVLSVDAVLLYDNAKEFSAYKDELQRCPHIFKPMWNVWPRSTVLQSAAAKIEVAKMLERKKHTST